MRLFPPAHLSQHIQGAVAMKVMKFGGTSVATAQRIETVARLVTEASRSDRVGVVVSAVAGVTNLLVESSKAVLAGSAAREYVDSIPFDS